MKVLRLKLKQPTAHYRIPFTFSRRHTYPIPPYSTVIGFICNILGIKNQEEEKFKNLKNGLSLAIYGKFDSITKEYIWLRNLEREAHINRFGSETNRIIDQIPEHPGEQIPTRIDVLENVNLIIYIYHPDEKFLENLKETIKNPSERIYPLHLGRAEDLILFDNEINEAIKIIEININEKEPYYGNFAYFTWLPSPENIKKKFYEEEDYKNFFRMVKGSFHLITSFYEIKEGIRDFKYIPVKLFEQGSFYFDFYKPFEFINDKELKIPLFFPEL
ncbi:MAG: type I-B CRISPR-associated protein Cas5b [candidate division WOR-3 bacterium]|nr:type I-B CRISPR-associated protein Cas5b [candidate division WOR-3 bacterium]